MSYYQLADSPLALGNENMGDNNDSPMPIIGVYVAAASLACSFAMFLNSCLTFINSFPKFNLRFSRNFFPLNATWLTLLAVATKPVADLTTPKLSYQDNQAKIMNTVFLTVAMGNFFTSLGSMNNADIVTNLTALSILVITVVVDLYIQLRFHVFDTPSSLVIIIQIALLFSTWITIVSSALAVPAIKKRAESKYQKLASDERQMKAGQQHYRVEELRLSITKYWVMAASGSPQLLMKRLVTFVYTNIICLFSALIAFLALFSYGMVNDYNSIYIQIHSEYKWSVDLILLSQYYVTLPTVVIATIFMISVVGYKYENNGIRISREEVTIESYWTEKLVEWRQRSIPIKFKRCTLRKLIHSIKSLILNFCILIQIVNVMWCKFCSVISFYLVLPLLLLVNPLGKLINHYLGQLFRKKKVSEVDLNCFVILLEGEKQFPKKLLRGIINRVDKLVEMGKKQRPHNLFNLLNQSFSFGGVVQFDSNRVPSLLSGEPLNCWTLPVVTLTSIAIAIPNIASRHVDWLVSSANEGLRYASLIDVLDGKCGLKSSIKNAADVVWVGVELHRKWLDMDLKRKTGEISSVKDIIQDLTNVSERIVMEFSSKENRMIVENPLYWPANVLAANSMYRITRTILLYYEDGECQGEELFRMLICMIADILAACLTNLPHMIYTKCISNAIEERLKSVRAAAIIFGETEDILKIFEERKLSNVGPSQPLCIDEWRGWIEQQAALVSSSATSNGASSVESNEHVVIKMQA
ncbi:PREDICTED: uncharacterized protein LOC109157637 [Ipomoea nil]|uniref:uncharacterized protein LOC109157637 n=1 Tax=Ipomoea nil TaxID=35883 RepID=UPI0009015554|nr:PREDICTED: uncharacterized protein LOC109157637 [Ipomoea nil]